MRGYSLRRLAWAGPCATIIAIVATLFYYAVTRAFGEEYLMPMNSTGTLLRPMPAIMPVVAIVFVGFVATFFFGLLARFSPKPATVFLSVSITALILSFGGSFYLPATALLTKILLGGMNIIAAAIIVGGILVMSRHKGNRPSL